MKKNQLILITFKFFVPFYGMANSTLEMIEKVRSTKISQSTAKRWGQKKKKVPTKKRA